MDIQITPLLKDDQEFLGEMLYHALFVPKGHKPFPKKIIHNPDLAKYIQDWGKDGDRGLMAIDTKTKHKIGAIWIRLFNEENKGYGYIDDQTPELSMAILPGYRGRGIGSTLLKELLQAVQNRYNAISLSVSVENPAVKLYSLFGFEIVAETNNSMIMKKELH